MHKISKLVCFAAPLNTRQAIRYTSERPSGHESFYSVAGKAARANLDAPRTVMETHANAAKLQMTLQPGAVQKQHVLK